ncbi:MAG: hypothetical protein DCC51_09365 [Anaerolineae bacterium]|mgnify:CR=1 FL=1|nr:MAG: hypothetical protein DCC51_09365 [Anaerolineae bacterium]
MAFNPRKEYEVLYEPIAITDFKDFAEEYIVRPPYQRKTVWSRKKQQALLDSLFRRYYIPRIVIREVRLSEDQTIREVIDGQQRIATVQAFLADELRLPASLGDVNPDLPGKNYSDLPVDIRKFVMKELKYNADLVKGIEDPHSVEHQRTASEIFWRLQQGESLNYMEIAHARLASRVRNFIVKYGDDYDFDYINYRPIDRNPHKHKFFRVYARDNGRMQHLSLLARLLLIEIEGGPTDTTDKAVSELIDRTTAEDGIGNTTYENEKQAKALLKNLNLMYEIFKDDPMVDENYGIKEMKVEYFVISVYLLVRHLAQYYVLDDKEKALVYEFVLAFHKRWNKPREQDTDILVFSDNRQQSKAETETRDRIMRQLFFEYARDENHAILVKDSRRAFNEAERIVIYRRYNGLCQQCLAEGKPEVEAQVSWSEFEADHVLPHSKGGQTDVENGQVLCRLHNKLKSNTI